MQEMTIHYTAAPEDMAAFWRHSPATRRSVYLLSLAIAAISLAPSLFAGRVRFADVVWAVVLGAACIVLFPFILRWRTKKDERTLSIDPLGISTRIGGRRDDVPWTRFRSVSVTDEHVFIQRSNLNVYSIPRRAFADDTQRAEFIRLCEKYFAASRNGVA